MGGIDVVVNAAGLLVQGPLIEQDGPSIQQQVQVNFLGALSIARYAHPWLKETQGSLLLFASSSYTRGRANYVTYSATKAAIVNLTQGLSEEWAADGIRVNCIIPGRTDTDMRSSNFQNETQDSLHNPYQVAISASKVICSNTNGLLTRIH